MRAAFALFVCATVARASPSLRRRLAGGDAECESGMLSKGKHACCPSQCGLCGGSGCATASTTSGYTCCVKAVKKLQQSCDDVPAPCSVSSIARKAIKAAMIANAKIMDETPGLHMTAAMVRSLSLFSCSSLSLSLSHSSDTYATHAHSQEAKMHYAEANAGVEVQVSAHTLSLTYYII